MGGEDAPRLSAGAGTWKLTGAVEIGPGLSSIDASWGGFVDLRTSPHAIDTLEEARHLALRKALHRVQCKQFAGIHIEVRHLGAGGRRDRSRTNLVRASTIPAWDSRLTSMYWSTTPLNSASFEFHERRARDLVNDLRLLAVQHGRVDIVLRAAVTKEGSGYGFTLYAAGCGADEASAYTAWQTVLAAVVAATIAPAPHPPRAGE